MNKIMMILSIFISSVVLYAGGDRNTNVSQSANIEPTTCKTDRIYTDKNTKLMWQDQAYTDAETGAYNRNVSLEKVGSWNHAVNFCMALNYQGYNDWRLPTSDELKQVHDKSGQVFTYYRAGDFWTSTASADKRYYVVYTADAYQYKRKKEESNYIRCVRCWVAVKKDTLYGMIQETAENMKERMD